MTQVDDPTRAALADGITFSVIRNRLTSISSEMSTALARTAMSALLSLTQDFSSCVYDGSGRLLAMADALPIHTNSMHLFLDEIVTRFEGEIAPGDLFICNDPYAGGTHIGDLTTAAPVFVGGELVLWAAIRAHQLDVGAPVPTSSYGGAENVWQEGVTFPPVKLIDAGRTRRDVVELYLANLRWPDRLQGDLYAQLGATQLGVRKLGELCDRYGADQIRSFADELIAYTSRRVAQEIRRLPSGRYLGEAWLDAGEEGVQDLRIRCAVEIEEDVVTVDFFDAPPQVARGVNSSRAVMEAAGGIPVILLGDPDIPRNGGWLEHLRVTAPEGTVCHATHPASTALATVIPGDVMQEAVARALVNVDAERATGGPARWGCIPMLSGLDERSGEFWGHQLLNSGGAGAAAAGADGWPLLATMAARGGLRSASIEHSELLYPIFIERWEIEPESMGLGAFIGGAGVRFTVRPVGGDMEVVYSSDGLRNPPFGALGATPGAGGGSYVEGRDELRPLPVHVVETVTRDEAWTAVSTGGGGYGNPLERPIEQVRCDVRDGLYGRGAAKEVFGVILSDDLDPVVDGPATRAERESIARRQAEHGLPLVTPDTPGSARWRPS